MPRKSDAQSRVRILGLSASVTAIVALSIAVLSDNRDAGFGRTVTHNEQVFLLLIAVLLFAVQAIAYLIHRGRRTGTDEAAGNVSATPRVKNRS